LLPNVVASSEGFHCLATSRECTIQRHLPHWRDNARRISADPFSSGNIRFKPNQARAGALGKGHAFPFGAASQCLEAFVTFRDEQALLLFEIQGRYALNRRIARTESGYLGLVSYDVETGDSVVICKGSSVPLIMRRTEGEDEFRLVGDAYVHGVMRGEAFQEDKCQRMNLK